MKKLLCFLLLSLLIFTGCSKKDKELNTFDEIIDRGYVIVGVKTDSFPFGFIDEETGNNDGFDIDVAKYIAKDLLGSDRKIQYVSVTPDTRIEAVTSGKVDMVIATMSITPQREYLIDFSKPYFAAGQTAVVNNDSEIHTFSDLKNKTIIIVLGSNSEKNIRNIIPTARIIGYKNYYDAYNALINGKGDALSTDDTILAGLIAGNDSYRLLKNRISKELYAIGIKQTDDKKLKNNLDILITRMQNDGTIKELKQKWNLN